MAVFESALSTSARSTVQLLPLHFTWLGFTSNPSVVGCDGGGTFELLPPAVSTGGGGGAQPEQNTLRLMISSLSLPCALGGGGGGPRRAACRVSSPVRNEPSIACDTARPKNTAQIATTIR